jgi:hypothetical protein
VPAKKPIPAALPLVAIPGGSPARLSENWLVLSIEKAAALAGHDAWPLATEVARAVLHYLSHDFRRTKIERETLELILRRSLTGIGCPAIARHFELISSAPSINLATLAQQAPFEILFFQQLASLVDEKVSSLASALRLEGLRSCVLSLTGSSSWRNSCQRLSDEIVHFIRARARTLSPSLLELTIW